MALFLVFVYVALGIGLLVLPRPRVFRWVSDQTWRDSRIGLSGLLLALGTMLLIARLKPELAASGWMSLAFGSVGVVVAAVALHEKVGTKLNVHGLTVDALGVFGLGVSLASLLLGVIKA